jgi:probable rRNA maturation factor
VSGGLSELSAISVHNRQRAIQIKVEKLQRFAKRALIHSSKLRPSTAFPQQIEVNLISDRRMSELHQRFLKLRGPTDVITFQHGEIFISVEMARRQARKLGTSMIEEIQLYLVHGLLHLRGFDDKTEAGARVMGEAQKQIVRAARSIKEGRFPNRP